jgi:UDP-N-acetylmuramoyl-tripeptide--D-alanyl-D-alanine ligase
MMMLSEIAAALNTSINGADVNITSIGTDSRSIVNHQLFVAIKGERFDGNKFAPEAITLGAAAALISDEHSNASPSILVKDTRIALGTLAHYWRNQFNLPVVAVTGSNGKTTVKEMIASILHLAKGNVLATRGNLNNDIGVPLTLLNLRAEHRCAVIEMGMNHLNEIRYLSHLARPQVAVVNNAGTAHIGELGSREAIAQAKGEIFEGLASDGTAIINADDDFVAYWFSLNQGRKIITFGIDKSADVTAEYTSLDTHTNVRLKTPEGTITFDLNALGKHNVLNALAASAVAVALGVPNQLIAEGLAAFNAVQGRLSFYTGYQQATVIDDTYNANPDSMKAAIDVLVSQGNTHAKKLIFVMGDMAELGHQSSAMHIEIGEYAKAKRLSHLLSFGEMSQQASTVFGRGGKHFTSLDALVAAIKADMQVDTCVLVKGSRSSKMERVVNAIIDSKHAKGAH